MHRYGYYYALKCLQPACFRVQQHNNNGGQPIKISVFVFRNKTLLLFCESHAQQHLFSMSDSSHIHLSIEKTRNSTRTVQFLSLIILDKTDKPSSRYLYLKPSLGCLKLSVFCSYFINSLIQQKSLSPVLCDVSMFTTITRFGTVICYCYIIIDTNNSMRKH